MGRHRQWNPRKWRCRIDARFYWTNDLIVDLLRLVLTTVLIL